MKIHEAIDLAAEALEDSGVPGARLDAEHAQCIQRLNRHAKVVVARGGSDGP
jgi:hypothetical protein